jgi:phosphoglycerol transferase MdoB-like AlkP superfamily enzyme
MQTPKGQLSVLASIPDLTAGKVLTHYPGLNLHCLPQIMKESGFETFFFQGQPSLEFDNTGSFMKRNGFDHVHAVAEFLSPDEERRYTWGWGIQDNILYQKTFQYLDEAAKTIQSNHKEARNFVVLATISNHAKFGSVPEAQRYLYPKQLTKKQRYANSIRVADEYLRTFFQELHRRDRLTNSIVFITGDHSFPVGEHGYFDNESGFYNEYFKTPLLIWGKSIPPAISHETHSQLDIAPTVLELLGISAKVHFTGKSLFFSIRHPPAAGSAVPAPAWALSRIRKKYIYRDRPRQPLSTFAKTPSRNQHRQRHRWSAPLPSIPPQSC